MSRFFDTYEGCSIKTETKFIKTLLVSIIFPNFQHVLHSCLGVQFTCTIEFTTFRNMLTKSSFDTTCNFACTAPVVLHDLKRPLLSCILIAGNKTKSQGDRSRLWMGNHWNAFLIKELECGLCDMRRPLVVVQSEVTILVSDLFCRICRHKSCLRTEM